MEMLPFRHPAPSCTSEVTRVHFCVRPAKTRVRCTLSTPSPLARLPTAVTPPAPAPPALTASVDCTPACALCRKLLLGPRPAAAAPQLRSYCAFTVVLPRKPRARCPGAAAVPWAAVWPGPATTPAADLPGNSVWGDSAAPPRPPGSHGGEHHPAQRMLTLEFLGILRKCTYFFPGVRYFFLTEKDFILNEVTPSNSLWSRIECLPLHRTLVQGETGVALPAQRGVTETLKDRPLRRDSFSQ